jgi:hypothetical protein
MSAVARTIDNGDHVESALDLVTAAAAVSGNGDDDEGPLGRPLLLPEEEPNDWAKRHSRRRLHSTRRNNKNKDNDSSSPPAVGLGLKTFAYLIEPEEGLRAVTIHEALHSRGGGDSKRQQQQHAWIDAILSDDNAFRDLQTTIFDELDVSSFLRRHLNQPHLIHSPQVLSLTNALLMVMRIIDDDIDQTCCNNNNGEPNGGDSNRTVLNSNVNIDNNNDRNKKIQNLKKKKNTTTSAGSEGKSASYTVVLCLEEGLMISATKMASTTPPPPDTVVVNVAAEEGDENNNNPAVSDLSRRSSAAATAVSAPGGGGGGGSCNDNTSSRSGSATTTTMATNTVIASMYDRELMDHSISGVLCLYLSYHLERTSSATHHLRDRVLALLERLDTDVGSIQWREVVDLKNTAMRVSAVAEEQNQCILRLAEADASSDSFGFVKGSVNVLLSLAGSTERMVDRLEARVADVRGGYDAHQQDRIRHRLDLLTIMSAVFLPLTLLAGIWGMSTFCWWPITTTCGVCASIMFAPPLPRTNGDAAGGCWIDLTSTLSYSS